MNIENLAGETLTKAMANRNLISFQYDNFSLYGKEAEKEQVGNAHIILISTDKLGQSIVMVDFPNNERRKALNWRYFDINKMSDIRLQ
ncbi:MAG: hypothetical protein KGQ36_00925 [Rickettsiales bacterium]|nr:hypothetical protein [Rickettsiales bacterium]